MNNGLGKIEDIAASGNWGFGEVSDMRDLFYNTLLNETEDHAYITTFSLGQDNEEVNEFFNIIEKLLGGNRVVKIIVNDDGKKNGTCSSFARDKMEKLRKKFPDYFFPQYFRSTKTKILHAKLTLIDNKIALVGSANISKRALVSNYEVMLKVGQPAAAKLSLMFEELSKELDRKDGI